MTNKNKLVSIFNENADLYDKYRPGYSDDVIDHIISSSGMKRGAHILEIGCGTGQITKPFAEKGFKILCLEKGKKLARLASSNLNQFSEIEVNNIAFENWEPLNNHFDLFLSAQAFHWIKTDLGIKIAGDVLKKDGTLCLVWHLDKSQDTEFWKATIPVYAKYMTVKTEKPSLDESKNMYMNAIESDPNFDFPDVKLFSYEKKYSTSEYMGLLNTFSDHMTMKIEKRACFFNEIRDIIISKNGEVNRKYETIVITSKKVQ